MSNRLFFLIVLFQMLIHAVSAQSYRLFTTEDGLPSTSISYLFQDSHGFFWIATENGLVRYDGARFKTYVHRDNDHTSLAHDFVTSLDQDSDGHLFVSTYMGVQVYDYNTDTFSPNVVWEDGSQFKDNANYVFCSSKGKVYSVGYSINSLNYDGKILKAKKLNMPLNFKNYNKMQEDKDGRLWISHSGSNTLFCLDNDLVVADYELVVSSGNTSISDFSVSSDGAVFVLTSDNGLWELDQISKSFFPIDITFPTHNNIRIMSRNEYLYMSGDCGFAAVFDRKKKALNSSVSEILKTLFPDGNVNQFISDREGNHWLSITQKGVLMLRADLSPFNIIGHQYVNSDNIGHSPVRSIYQDAKGKMWISTDGDGVYILNQDLKVETHLKEPSSATCFHEDNYGNLWIGDTNQGVACYNQAKASMSFDVMKSDKGKVLHAFDIESDNFGKLWVATMGNGLFYYDNNTGKARCINDVNPYIHKWLTSIYVASDGNLWAGSYDGLEHVDVHNPDFKNRRLLKRTIVYDIKADEDETLWIATSSGLFRMNQNGDTLSRYTTTEGLPSQSIASIQIDESGVIWVTSNMGLSRVNPSSGLIVNFFSDDGLQGNEFCKKSSYADRIGRLWFGGNNGVTYFSPNDVLTGNKPWHVRLVAMTLNGEDVTTATMSGKKAVTDVPIFQTDEINLDFDDNTFSLFFGTEELNCPEKMQFEYSLDNQPWQKLPIGVHSVSFSNLASGHYRFAVRAVNSQRGTTERVLNIIIRPVWYKTTWALSALILIVIAFIVLLIIIILAHYRNKNDRLLAEKQEAMHDAQTRFFINLTHEIRTPLMLIIDPVRNLLSSDNEPSRQNSYLTIIRNANRILRLMEQMIALRKADKGVLYLQFSECNLIDLLGNVYADFIEQARLKQIDFVYDHGDIEHLPIWVDSDYFDKIVINLVSNAIKYTQTGGKVTMRVCLLDAQWVQIDVIDNGPGIDESEQTHIFERFYRSKSAQDTNVQGSGIGLDLTRTLVNMHHGRIELLSSTKEPTGSTFSVILPLGNDHLNEMEKSKHQKTESRKEFSSSLSIDEHVSSKTKYRILVADDEPEMLSYIKRELSSDFHVQGCTNGEEALVLLQREKFHLVVSDVMMPKLDGIALCSKIRQHIRLNHIPVILLTANAEEKTMITGIEHGADEYLLKPVSIELLRSRIYNLIHNRELLYNNFAGRQLDEDKLEKLHEKTPDEQLLERVMRVLNCELGNPNLTVEMLADKVGLSRVHLNRKLKELTNQTARDFIRNVRLSQAADLLSQGNIPINRVATMVGFSSAAHFATSFQAFYGVSPKNYCSEENKDVEE